MTLSLTLGPSCTSATVIMTRSLTPLVDQQQLCVGYHVVVAPSDKIELGLNYFRWQGATGVAVCVVSESMTLEEKAFFKKLTLMTVILLMRLYVLYLLNKRILIVMLVGFVISSGFAAAIMGLVMQRVTGKQQV